jgi:hypothetical protein
MFFPKEENGENEKEQDTQQKSIIISTDAPVKYTESKNIILSRGVNKEEYDEIYEFLRDSNQMASGNFTIFPKDEIARYMRFDSLAVLMRSSKNNSLIGTIFSMIFPIHCISNTLSDTLHEHLPTQQEIINHGCTTFLNVHNKLRKHGLCMALIRELTQYAYEYNIYCSYSLTAFPLSPKSIPISAWYRPLNLPRSVGLGFTYPNWNIPGDFLKNRILYNTKMPKKYICERVTNSKLEMALNFYLSCIKDKKFAFSPDMTFFNKWIQEYATFLILFDKKPVGLFSIGSVYCRMSSGLDGKLALPLLFVTSRDTTIPVMKCMIFIANEREYDALYTHAVGDMTSELLKEVNFIETEKKSYFSLYNNSMTLTPSDLYVPLF